MGQGRQALADPVLLLQIAIGEGHARAISELGRAAALVPEASEVQNHLGLAYQAAGRETEAREAFTRAVSLDCDNGAARENLAVAEHSQPKGR